MCASTMLQNLENNRTEEIGLVTPTPGPMKLHKPIHSQWNYEGNKYNS